MPEATISAAQEPVQSLIDRWWEIGTSESEAQEQAICELEETLGSLADWGQKLSEQLDSREKKQHRLEHDVASLRSRVNDLEKGLQDRTQELLNAQAANNALAAQLQQAEVEPLADYLVEQTDVQTDDQMNEEICKPTDDQGEHLVGKAEEFGDATEISEESSPAESVAEQQSPIESVPIEEGVSVSERFGKLRDRHSSQSAAG